MCKQTLKPIFSQTLQHTFFKILRIFKFDTQSSVSDLSYLPDLAEIPITKDLVAGYLPSGQLKLMLPIQFVFLQTKCHDAWVKLQPTIAVSPVLSTHPLTGATKS